MLSIGVSSSQFISILLFCGVSGQKIKSFVIADVHFVQRVQSYSGNERKMKAEGERQNKRKNKKVRTWEKD